MSGPGGRDEAWIGSRREARERALELAYEMDRRSISLEDVVAALPLEPAPYTMVLLRAAELERTRADQLISDTSTRWPINRMPVMDVVVMRLAVAEMLTTDTPTGVILAEAVDMASRYSTEESGKFVNGVLSAIARSVRV